MIRALGNRPARALAGAAFVVAIAGACGDDGGDEDAFCTSATDRDRFEAMVDDLDPTDVDAAIATFREVRQAEADLRATAPEAVRADIDVLIGYLDDLVEGLETTSPGDGERPPVYDELQSRADQVEAASQRIELYVETNC